MCQEKKLQVSKSNYLYTARFHGYEISRKGKSINTESRLVLTWGSKQLPKITESLK